METNKEASTPRTLEEAVAERGEKVVLLLKKSVGRKHFRYALGEGAAPLPCITDGDARRGAMTYSVYAEYRDDEVHTVGSVPDFSCERVTAEGFCRLLARILATPLSLDAIYEDSFTP